MTFAFSPISTKHYLIGSYVGMFPISFVLVNLGESLATVDSMEQLFSTEVIMAFVLIGLVALVGSQLVKARSNKASAAEE